MTSDFGDESGEKLFDWMLRIGQDASGTAMLASAERLKTAFRNARGEISPGAKEAEDEVAEWAKLRMAEFEALPEYETIREAIDKKLDAEAIEHDFFTDGDGRDHLLFRLDDAPAVSRAFESLEKQTDKAVDDALKARGKTREQVRDEEPLEQRAASARRTAKATEAARDRAREVELSEMRAK